MNSQDASALASRQLCYDFIDRSIFCYQPKSYEQQYPKWPGEVGVEVEMLPLQNGPSKIPRSVPLQGGAGSLAAALRKLAAQNNWATVTESNDGVELLKQVTLDQGDTLTFEPGGQLEFSSKPYPCLSEVIRRLRWIQGILDQAGAEHGFRVQEVGTNPWHHLDDLGLQMPKARYQAMNEYFGRIGTYGARMMRQTCSVQVCFDFGSGEQTMVNRFLAAQYLAPFAAAIFANSPFVDGAKNGDRSFRTRVWRHVDPRRSGFPRLDDIIKHRTRKACIDSYFEFALQAPVVFVTAHHSAVPRQIMTFAQWLENGYDGVFPTMDDFSIHLSLLFPEVRPRGFLELRSIDGLARPWQIVVPAFYAGLLYDGENLAWVVDRLANDAPGLERLMGAATAGLERPEIHGLAQEISLRAQAGFERLPTCFRGEGSERTLGLYHELFVAQKKTPADALLAATAAAGEDVPSVETFRRLAASWQDMLV